VVRIESSLTKMTTSLKCQTLGTGLVIILSVFLTFSFVYADTGSTHDHHDHEGTQGYGDTCQLSTTEDQCKTGKGFHCDAKSKEATCICLPDFEDSYYKKENDTCMAKLNKKCRISQMTIPCDEPNAECTEKEICECKKGKECTPKPKTKSDGVPTVPGFTVLMTLALATGLTYLIM